MSHTRRNPTCTGDKAGKPHAKDFRIYREDTIKRKGKPTVHDCACSIYAEGTLYPKGVKTYLRPKNTGRRDWDEAERSVRIGCRGAASSRQPNTYRPPTST
jgi:hypothetical protein